MRTLNQLAAEALEVQDACNLVAVVNGFRRAMQELQVHVPRGEEFDAHPIVRLWVDKIMHLTQLQFEADNKLSEAYSWVFDRVNK